MSSTRPSLGRYLQELRLREDLSLEALAQRLNINSEILNSWELDQAIPSASQIFALSALLVSKLDQATLLMQLQRLAGASAHQAYLDNRTHVPKEGPPDPPLSTPAEEARPLPSTRKNAAVVIGTNYNTASATAAADTRGQLGTLRYAEADAQALAAVLEEQGYSVTSLIGPAATAKAIRAAIHAQAVTVAPEGLLLVHFSGHGTTDENGIGYIVPDDYQPGALYLDAIRMDDFVNRDLRQGVTTVGLLDCCRSGLAVGVRGETSDEDVGVRTFTEYAGRALANRDDGPQFYAILTACAGRHVAYEEAELGHGVFTHFALDHWNTYPGEVTAASLFTAIEAGLAQRGRPKPVQKSLHEGSIVLRLAPVPAPAAIGAGDTLTATTPTSETVSEESSNNVSNPVQIFPDQVEFEQEIMRGLLAEFEVAAVSGDPAAVITAGLPILVLVPDHPIRADLGKAYYTLGLKYQDTQRRQAIEGFSRAITLDPQNAEYHFRRSLVFRQIADPGAAEADMTQVILLEPGQAHYHFCRGDIRFERRNYSGARDDYYQASLLNRKNGDYYLALGRAYEAMDEKPNALQCFKWAYALKCELAKQEFDRLAAELKGQEQSTT